MIEVDAEPFVVGIAEEVNFRGIGSVSRNLFQPEAPAVFIGEE